MNIELILETEDKFIYRQIINDLQNKNIKIFTKVFNEKFCIYVNQKDINKANTILSNSNLLIFNPDKKNILPDEVEHNDNTRYKKINLHDNVLLERYMICSFLSFITVCGIYNLYLLNELKGKFLIYKIAILLVYIPIFVIGIYYLKNSEYYTYLIFFNIISAIFIYFKYFYSKEG